MTAAAVRKKSQKKTMTPTSKKPKWQLNKEITTLSSDEYHSIEGTYSSSQFKDILDDEELFIKKYIEKTIPRGDVPAFGTGNYFHTGVLEPHKLKTEYLVYSGKVRRGENWDKFKAKNGGKIILTAHQREQGDRLISLAQDSPVAMGFIKRGRPEVSLFVELWVLHGEIFAPDFDKVLDAEVGWIDFPVQKRKKDFEKAFKIVVKVRADSIGEDFILDLKSTTGNARSEPAMRGKISYYNYDLSASLYLDVFSLLRGFQMDLFIWTFASKDMHNCKSYRASRANILVGRAKWVKGIIKMAEGARNDWQLYDSLGVLEPEHFQLEWIRSKETDLV